MKFLTILVYETRRYLYSDRIFLLILVSVLPNLLFLHFTAEGASLEILINETRFLHHLTIGLVLFTFLIQILISIVVTTDLVGGEPSLEFLLLTTNRVEILLGKTIACYFILLSGSFLSLVSFFTVLLVWQITFLPFSQLWMAIILMILLSLIPLSFSLFSSSLTLKIRVPAATGAYITVFLFFVIPFIIYFSFYQASLFSLEMLSFSIHQYVQQIVAYALLGDISVTQAQFENAVTLLTGMTILSFLLSMVLFWRTESS